jgi:hypothetical protein
VASAELLQPRRFRAALVLLALTAAGCAGESSSPPSTARLTARAYYEAIARQDWPAAFALLDTDAQARIGPATFEELGRRWRTGIGFEPGGVEVRSCDERGESAFARIVIAGKAAESKKRFRDEVTLHRGPAGWRVVPREGFAPKR